MAESRIYPNKEQLNNLKNPLTEGEKCLIEYLDKYLPKDNSWTKDQKLSEYNGWIIFAQPFLNGSRPDVVVYNPFVGLIIYEVKDWRSSHYSWNKVDGDEKPSVLYVSDKRGKYSIKRPDKQVEHYKEKIIGQLVPIIGETIDKNSKNFGLIKTGLYFHNCNTKEAQETFGVPIKDFRYFPVLGRDGLIPENLEKIVPGCYYKKSVFWDLKWNDELLFWLIPPFHSIEQGIPLTLKGNQFKVAEPKSGHYRVRGVAGSGKTQALAYRAGKLASQGKNILIISFNITLWHYIKDMIQRAPFNFKWDQFTFSHFHGFCKDKLNEFGFKWPKSPKLSEFQSYQEYEVSLEDFFRRVVPAKVINVIKDNPGKYDVYDAILIDEGQDYYFEWYSMLNDYFLNSNDELVVVCDKKQNIYERELDWLDKRVTRKGLDKFIEPYIDLLASYRLPPRVAQMSNDFSDMFNLNQELRLAKVDSNPVLFNTQHIIWLNINNNDWLSMIHKSFNRLKHTGYNPTDMVILLPNHDYGTMCLEYFKNMNIEVNHVFETDNEAHFHPHKKAFWMGDARLKMSTIHSFKGWELLNIILFIPETAPESDKKLDAIVYTAITRTRENLIVLNANKRYDEFGLKFPKKWDKQ